MLRPLEPTGTKLRLILGIAFFALFIAFWSWLTFGGIINKLFLANPAQMLSDGWRLLVEDNFLLDIAITVWRVLGGFVLAAVIAVPIGIAMGTWTPVEAFLGPAVSFARYLPVSAFIPLLVLWAGIGETQKLLVIFLGSVFQIILMVSVAVANTRRDLVEAAYTLGSSPNSLVRRVIIPANAPDIAEILRLVLGWAWTYVIVAELIGASSGIGYMVTSSTARIATGQIIFGIIIIGLIGMISDVLFKALNRALFAWRQA
jgi:NitT/TauT family transport system permease protein